VSAGLGLGLALVRSLIELHGGRVTAHSEGAGRGSSFTITLPLANAYPDEYEPVVNRGESLPERAPRRSVLIVDDNVDAAEMLADVIRADGHTVVVCHDGPTALTALSDYRPELAILDIGLPVMDGHELAMKIREKLRESAPKMVALTGYGQPTAKRRSADAGFIDHLVKPIDPIAIAKLVSRAVDDETR
jgi:CheY-like chemotaxis protein